MSFSFSTFLSFSWYRQKIKSIGVQGGDLDKKRTKSKRN